MRYNYPIKSARKFGFDLAACLQTILKLRRVYEPSQEEIVGRLGRDSLGNFLGEWELDYEFHSIDKIASVPIFLDSALNDAEDVMACYDYYGLSDLDLVGDSPEHFAIVSGYEPREGLIELVDSYEPEKPSVIRDEKLAEVMNYGKHGFWVVG